MSGLEYLAGATSLLQRVRSAESTASARAASGASAVWEAADIQWWWRKPRPTDAWPHPFWFTDDGEPIAAAVATDWGGRIALDILAMPTCPIGVIEQAWEEGLAAVRASGASTVEVMVDEADTVMVPLLEDAGFTPLPERGSSAWMTVDDRPRVSDPPVGYALAKRSENPRAPHHFIARNGPLVAQRLAQTSLYRPDLDLTMLDVSGDVAAYGLFWFDPTTKVGFVEPIGTNDGHRRQGLARHLLTAGIELLAQAGCTRIKINYEQGNQASSSLYLDTGFVPTMTTALWVNTTPTRR